MPSEVFPFSGPLVNTRSRLRGLVVASTRSVPPYCAPIATVVNRLPATTIRDPSNAAGDIFEPSTSRLTTFQVPWSSLISAFISDCLAGDGCSSRIPQKAEPVRQVEALGLAEGS